MNDFAVGRGLLPMDLLVTAALWFAAGVAVYVSTKRRETDSPRAIASRWTLGVGFLLLACMLTLRLIQWGDLPMSPPYAAGLLLICVGYVGVALDRTRS